MSHEHPIAPSTIGEQGGSNSDLSSAPPAKRELAA